MKIWQKYHFFHFNPPDGSVSCISGPKFYLFLIALTILNISYAGCVWKFLLWSEIFAFEWKMAKANTEWEARTSFASQIKIRSLWLTNGAFENWCTSTKLVCFDFFGRFNSRTIELPKFSFALNSAQIALGRYHILFESTDNRQKT